MRNEIAFFHPLKQTPIQVIQLKIIKIILFLVFCNLERYIVTMIKDFRDNWLQKFFVEDIQVRKIPADIRSRLFRKLQLLDDATHDADLRSPPSNHYKKLSG